jgi:hypothetical protein
MRCRSHLAGKGRGSSPAVKDERFRIKVRVHPQHSSSHPCTCVLPLTALTLCALCAHTMQIVLPVSRERKIVENDATPPALRVGGAREPQMMIFCC